MRALFFPRLSALAIVVFAFASEPAAADPALITYEGDVVFGSFSSLTMELGGTARGTRYDAINVTGKLTFGGTMDVVLIDGFNPAQGDSFNLFDWGSTAGSFGTVNFPALAEFLAWETSELYVTGTISVISTLTPIEQWRLHHFGFHTNTGIAANDADHEGDGSVNLLEYAFFLDPLVPATIGLPTVGQVTIGANRHLTITFTRPLSATDIIYFVEVSGGLLTWLPGSSYASGGDVPSNANTTQVSRTANSGLETIVVRDNTALNTAGKRFLRVKITLP